MSVLKPCPVLLTSSHRRAQLPFSPWGCPSLYLDLSGPRQPSLAVSTPVSFVPLCAPWGGRWNQGLGSLPHATYILAIQSTVEHDPAVEPAFALERQMYVTLCPVWSRDRSTPWPMANVQLSAQTSAHTSPAWELTALHLSGYRAL